MVLVEDDVELGSALKEMIQRIGYQCTHFEAAEDAIAGLEAYRAKETLFVCDIQLPNQSGLALAETLRRDNPWPFLFISGNVQPSVLRDVSRRPDSLFLRKPVSLEDLRAALTNLKTRTIPIEEYAFISPSSSAVV